MPDWEKLAVEKHQDILIGRCENQALDLLKGLDFDSKDIQDKYKKYVKMLYILNTQVEQEILRPQSDLYKPCPKCKENILKGWKRHDKCGWTQ